jgi:hypothetical protein
MLALSAAAGHGVVHQFQFEDVSYLLRGDGSVPATDVVELRSSRGWPPFLVTSPSPLTWR